jgi:multiple sugar transport system permease protein
MLVLFLFAVYFLAPLFWVVVNMTKTDSDLFSTFSFWFSKHLALGENLHELFARQDGIFIHWLVNSFIYAGGAALLGTVLASLAGYAYAKYDFRGKALLFGVILGSVMVPSTALALPTFMLFSKLHLVNTYAAVILPAMVSPFGVYLMRIYSAQAIPDEMLDAARVDGASELRVFAQVALPVLMPGFATVMLFLFVLTWNNYFLPLVVLNDPTMFPVTLGLVTWNVNVAAGGQQLIYTVIILGAFVSLLPLIAVFLLLQRYWRSGLTVGAVH